MGHGYRVVANPMAGLPPADPAPAGGAASSVRAASSGTAAPASTVPAGDASAGAVPAGAVPAGDASASTAPAGTVPAGAVLAFHRRLPGYAPTPLLSLPGLASRVGVGELLVKCESSRFGLPAFKMLGASWATWRALVDHLGVEPGPWSDLDELARALRPHLPLTLAAATDGNHGRAVAAMARLLGLGSRILVPAGTSPARIAAIASEGASVDEVDGGYDEAVAASAALAGPDCLVVSDTSWAGYETVPGYVIEGYSTLFAEIDAALAAAGRPGPEVVVVPVGVGALAAAAVTHYRPPGSAHTALVGVEPTDAACLTASVLAGEPVSVPGPQRSVMVGLNCGTPSLVAWPAVSRGIDAFVTIDDDWALDAVASLAAAGVEAGETGAASLAGLAALVAAAAGGARPVAGADPFAGPGGPAGAAVAGEPAWRVGTDSRVLCLVTEGASDRDAWWRILGAEPIGPPAGS